MSDSSRVHGSHALYQGPTLVGPQRGEKELGFTGCGKTSKGERSPYPQRLKPDIITITYGRPEGRPLQKNLVFPQPVKPSSIDFLYGTAEPVPFVQSICPQ